ncbi:MAG: hypothetical protein ABFD97_15675, partial [Syntrophobacter sp.]
SRILSAVICHQNNDYGYVAMTPAGLDTTGSVVFEDRWKKVTPANLSHSLTSRFAGDTIGPCRTRRVA